MSPFRTARRLTRLHAPRTWAGFFFGDGALNLAVAVPSGVEINVLKQASATAPAVPGGNGNAATPVLQWQTAAEELRRQFDPHEHRIITAIGCENVLCETLQLPTTDPIELQQMLDLQIDNLSPLPTEEIVYSFEPLDVADGKSRVLVAIARKTAVNDRVAALEAAGLPAEIVSVDALAMFRALCQRKLAPVDDKLNVVVLFGTAAVHMVVYKQTQPVIVRSLLIGAETLGTIEGQTAAREELQRTLVAAETVSSCCLCGRAILVALNKNVTAAAMTLAGSCGLPVECLRNDVVPSPAWSLCLDGSAAADRPRLNLLPNEWRQRRQHARLRRCVVRSGIALAVVYVAALVMFMTALAWRKAKLHELQNQVGQLQKPYTEARRLHAELVAMQKQLDTKYSALEVLREVSVLKPNGLYFTSLIFRKDQTLMLKGQAQSASASFNFAGQLEKSGMFIKVENKGARTDPANGLTRFEIVCTLQPAAGGMTGVPE